MSRTTLALVVLLVLGGCQGSETPQTTAEKCSSLDMEIATTQENDSIEQDAKDEMISGYQQEKADLNCP
jgi:ABC-type glycerol-3-phosphate transport system substrate-binding protein